MIFLYILFLIFAGWAVISLFRQGDAIQKQFDDIEERMKSAVPEEDYERFFKGMKNDRLMSQATHRFCSWQIYHHFEDQKKMLGLLDQKANSKD